MSASGTTSSLGAFFIRHFGSGRLDQDHLRPLSGTPFATVRRRLHYYCRSFWNVDLRLVSTGHAWSDKEGRQSYLQQGILYLPETFDAWYGIPGREVYRAAVAHAICHLRYGEQSFAVFRGDALTRCLIDIVEDARIEALAMREFPGLNRLWKGLHGATPEATPRAGNYFERLARALIDPAYEDPDEWVRLGRSQFYEGPLPMESAEFSGDLGSRLAQAFRRKKIPFKAQQDRVRIPYRDDNRYCWRTEGGGRENSSRVAKLKKNRRFKFFGLNVNLVDESDNPSAKQFSLFAALFNFQLDIGVSTEDKDTDALGVYRYPEWDYKLQIERPSWVRVLEKIPDLGEASLVDDIITQHKSLISRMRFMLDALQPEENQRLRKLEEGDEVDLNAAIRAQCDIRLGIPPDMRIMMRTLRKNRDIAVLVLLDLSRSTTEKLPGQTHSVLELTRQACVLLADAIGKVGDPFAIHGFCSDSRHNVSYYCFKNFDQPYDGLAKARMAGMKGKLSTRMGAAIRHATTHLEWQKKGRKLLILLTDGEPADVDVRDRKYLRYDTKRAVEMAAQEGVQTYCMTLDPRADQYVSGIFGARNYLVVDHVARLPEKLPLLYAGLTRSS
ncbi:MAG: VWA domain-containing protein [Ferrovum sp.]|nr:VWA domain-containing protein [Ferrovum sp.]NDU86740.1 VWA domain-containing protein [Ferrovum sp.]